jgi:hypothetical protein
MRRSSAPELLGPLMARRSRHNTLTRQPFRFQARYSNLAASFRRSRETSALAVNCGARRCSPNQAQRCCRAVLPCLTAMTQSEGFQRLGNLLHLQSGLGRDCQHEGDCQRRWCAPSTPGMRSMRFCQTAAPWGAMIHRLLYIINSRQVCGFRVPHQVTAGDSLRRGWGSSSSMSTCDCDHST